MFGLMRAKKCGMSADEREFRRLNYCGTCKTIGSLYGQKSRLMLNHDTVFLAELLTTLSGENVGDWQKSYQSYNCLSLPKTEMPVSLQFAAAANVILAEFKIADHIQDSRRKRFKLAHRIFSKEFTKAEKSLNELNFPLAEVRKLLQTQEKLEAGHSSLETLAAPTARTTALFFARGAELIGKNELKNTASEIGAAFGKLIYLLDAFEDFEKDAKTRQFNAIRSVFGFDENKLSPAIRRKVTTILRETESEIIVKIDELPIDGRQKQIFISRLRENLDKKLATGLPVLKVYKQNSPKPKLTFSEKYRYAVESARKLARGFSWQMPLVFAFVFVFALAAPAQSREAKSARECFDLSFNLMFLGAIFGAAVSVKTLFQENQQGTPPEGNPGNNHRGKEVFVPAGTRGRNSQGSFFGCCDGCDCCCDCMDCCECASGCDC